MAKLGLWFCLREMRCVDCCNYSILVYLILYLRHIMSLTRGEAYGVLELPVGADPDSIRRSYRRLASKWHPDKHRGTDYADAFTKFQQISIAFKRLITDSDVVSMTKREMYEMYLQKVPKSAGSERPKNQQTDSLNAEQTNAVELRNGTDNANVEQRKTRKKKKDKKQPARKEDEKWQPSNETSLENEQYRLQNDERDALSTAEGVGFSSAFYYHLLNPSRVDRGSRTSETSDDKSTYSQPSTSEAQEEQLDDFVLQSRQYAITGNGLANSGDYVKAIKCFTEAIRLDPSEFRYFGNRSYCFDRIHQYNKALADAETAISLSPDWPKGYFRKGRALIGLKKYVEAEWSFKRVLQLDTQCEDAVVELDRIKLLQLEEVNLNDNQAGDMSSDNVLVSSPANSSLRPRLVNRVQSSAADSPVHSMSHPPRQPVDIKMDPSNPEGLTALWVGNVLPDVPEKTLLHMFSQYGAITSVRSLPDKFCAFINFKNKKSAAQALVGLQGTECHGQKLLIRFPDNPIQAVSGTGSPFRSATTAKRSDIPRRSNKK